MTKSFVLKALRIFSLDEMLKLSEAAKINSSEFKKAAGDDSVDWPAPSQGVDSLRQDLFSRLPQEAEIIPFKRPSVPPEKVEDKKPQKTMNEKGSETLSATDFLLWQRELSRDCHSSHVKKEAMKGYSKIAEMYVVKTNQEGETDKIRFASTNGVLVDKKQS